jgi:hypothetical protein
VSRALLVGVVLAVTALAYVFYPLVAPRASGGRRAAATTKSSRAVSDEEIEAAIRAYRENHVGRAACPVCGPRPEADAMFCSTCGRHLGGTPGAP